MRLLAIVALALVWAGGARASIWIANDAANAGLRVDAQGNAEVRWRDGRGRHTILVPPSGRLRPGGTITGRDVSRPASVRLPYARVVRRTPDGTQWALQAWASKPGGPVELHLARWRGSPTQITAAVAGDRLTGRITFGGAPVTGTSPTPEGKRLRIVAWVDGYAGARWQRLSGVAPRADGTFALFLRPAWQAERYRVTVAGPNRGTQLAPDAQAVVVP